MLPPRETYQSTGRVSWGRLAVAFVLSSPLALMAGCLLCVAFRNGFFLLFLIPLLAGVLAGGTALIAVSAGRCRNRWVGAAVGLVAGLVALVSYYQFDLAYEAGGEALYRLDLLARHVRHRAETDRIQWCVRTPPIPAQVPIMAGRPQGAREGWDTLVFDVLCLMWLPIFLGWARASRPFSEKDDRWLHEHLFAVEPEDAREMAEALDEGDAAALAELARPIPNRLSSKRGEVRLYYLPYRADSPVYLTLRIVDGRPWSHGWPQNLATRVRLSADEALALAEQLRPPGATFGALNVLPVPDQPRRAAPAAAIEDLPPDGADKVLNRRANTALLVVALAPLELALLVALGLGTLVVLHWSDLGAGAKAGAVAAIPAALVAGFVLTARYGDGLVARIHQRLLAGAVRQRPSAIVQPDDPDAVYVSVIPRENWGRLMLEMAADVGLLKIDGRRRELLFEGVRQRWRIPADSVESCELEEFSIGTPAPNRNNVSLLAVLRVSRDGGAWEAPLRPRQTTLLAPTAEAKRQRCRQLRERIQKELLGGPVDEPPGR